MVAEDDSALEGQSRSLPEPALDALGEETGADERPTQALLIGWNERAPIVVSELDHYAPPGSTLTVADGVRRPGGARRSEPRVTVVKARPTDRAVLDEHVVAGLDQIIVLCYSDDLEAQTADARTLVTLLHVRDILGKLDADDAGGQRDARRPQPGAGLGRATSTTSWSAARSSACWSPSCPRTSGSRRCSRSCSARGQRDLPAAGGVVRPAGPRGHLRHRRRGREPARRDRGRLKCRRCPATRARRTASGSTRRSPQTFIDRAGRPGRGARRGLTCCGVHPASDPDAGCRGLAGPARRDRVEPGRHGTPRRPTCR